MFSGFGTARRLVQLGLALAKLAGLLGSAAPASADSFDDDQVSASTTGGDGVQHCSLVELLLRECESHYGA
ncbi:MAG: hypothetical protein M3R02_02700 [Chloroflexota bacterium]|nr:hypothetical protein [Chloroflexota bacterium]